MDKHFHIKRAIRHFGLLLLLVLVYAIPARAQFVRIEQPGKDTVSYLDRIFVIARGRPNFPMTLSLNGDDVQTLQVRADLKADFLDVQAQNGPNLVKVSQTLPNGMVFADSLWLHVVGPAAQIDMYVEPPILPADRTTEAVATIRVLDQWGLPLADNQIVSVYLENGEILTEDIYPDQPGVQLQIKDGQAMVTLVGPDQIGEGILRAAVNDVSVETLIAYTQPFEPWTLTGTATGQIGIRGNKNPPTGVNPGDAYKKGAYAEGKLAFYGRGSISKGMLLTTSFDSDRRFDHRVFRFLTPERFFPIHGDASSIFYEAPSASRLYVRLTHDASFLQYGDFATNLARNELVAYTRTFTGVSGTLQKARTDLQVFGASTDQSIQVDQIPGEGISGLYYLSASRTGVPLVEGSERVSLQTRDRVHSENVLKEQIQYRFTDYDIDYDSGTLLFKRPVPFRTPDENPVIIVVTYETARALVHHSVGGGRIGYTPHERVNVGGTVVGEERSGQNFWLTGFDSEWRPREDLTLTSELARTSPEFMRKTSQDGWAWKLGAKGRVRESMGYEFYYRDADLKFENPSSPTARPGVRKIRGRFNMSAWNALSLQTEAFREDDDLNGSSRNSGGIGATYRYKTLTNQIRLETTQAERQGNKSNSTIMTLGSEWAARRWLGFGYYRDQSFGSQDISYRPTLNRLISRVSLNERFQLVGEHSFRDGSFADSSFTAVGLQSRVAGDLTAYANYELDGGINGYRNQAIVGLRHQYSPYENIRLNGGFERVRTLRGNNQGDFTAYNIAGEYVPPERVKASGRVEFRNGTTLDKVVGSGAVDFTLRRGFSLLAKHTYLGEDRRGAGALLSGTTQRAHHFLSGLAYRALGNDYVNALGKYEYKYERNSLINPGFIKSTHIGSFETIIEPRSQIEFFLRYGFKVNYLDSEGIATRSLTDLWMTNVRYEWHQQFDVLGEYRVLYQHTANDLVHGTSLEVGMIPQQSMRVALGYNFSGFDDRDFSGNNYWAHGPFMKIQIKFTERIVAGWLSGLQAFVK